MNNLLPVFRFSVDWGEGPLEFAEASGLTMEVQAIEYRHGLQREPIPIRIPGLKKVNNITLKRGMLPGDNRFFNWVAQAHTGDQKKEGFRRDVTISLLDETGKPVVLWRVKRAWPVKVEGPGLKASGNELAIESIELAHEGLTVEHP